MRKATFVLVAFILALLIYSCKTTELIFETKSGAGEWKTNDYVLPGYEGDVYVRVRPIKKASIRWYHIYPIIAKRYNNAYGPTGGPNAYKWKGFEKIPYERVELTRASNRWEFAPLPLHKGEYISNRFFRTNVGTFWFQAEVTLKDGTVLKSPGLEQVDYLGVGRDTFRISVYETNDIVGYLTAFFNIPNVFGATVKQTRAFIAVDCANVLAAADMLKHGETVLEDLSAHKIAEKYYTGVDFEVYRGRTGKTIRWDKDIKRGDMLVWRSTWSKKFHHIVIMLEDKNGNGVLDRPDTFLHSGPWPLRVGNMGYITHKMIKVARFPE